MFSSVRLASPLELRLLGLLSAAGCVGFSGSRHGLGRLGECAFLSLAALVPAGCRVAVGDARGVDAAVRSWFPGALVFRVSGSGVGAVVARSVSLVQSVAAAGGVLVVFPGRACPAGLLPSVSSRACFCGLSSGSWASAALAAGLSVPVLVWLPLGVVPPAWGFRVLGSGWFLLSPVSGRASGR